MTTFSLLAEQFVHVARHMTALGRGGLRVASG
jgi:hypothetical protein